MLSDYDEVIIYSTNPLLNDTDNDFLSDYLEVSIGADPLDNDTDSDGILDGKEVKIGTNPCSNDTDNDGMLDNFDPLPTINNYFVVIMATLSLVSVIIVLGRKMRRIII